MRILPLITFFALNACVSKDRAPSSLPRQGDASFELFNNENLLKSDYEFELVDLYGISKNQVQFKNYNISDSEAKRAVAEWVTQLRDFLLVAKSDQPLKLQGHTILIKLTDLNRLDRVLDYTQNNATANETLRKQVEIIAAFNENFKISNEGNLSSTLPFEIKKLSGEPPSTPQSTSSFWSDRTTRKIDHRHFTGDFDPQVFKNSCKTEPGEYLSILCQNKKYKLWPQARAKSAAMNSLLYYRMGYNVPLSFYIPQVRISYDRTLLAAKDFFNYTGFAQLQSGEAISLSKLKPLLVPYCKSQDSKCFSNAALYDTQFESRITYIVLPGVSVSEISGNHEFGSWRYDSLGHSQRPEIQSLLLIGAFTGNGELQKENNKLIWTRNFEIKHEISNVSGGYGRLRAGSSFDLNRMPWSVMKIKRLGDGSSVLVVDEYQPNIKRSVFAKANYLQLQMAARLIAGISEDELTAGLALSGFSAAEMLLAREKLISIQKNIAESMGLILEFRELANRKINKNIEYTLQNQNLIIPLKNGRNIQLPENNLILKNGILKKIID